VPADIAAWECLLLYQKEDEAWTAFRIERRKQMPRPQNRFTVARYALDNPVLPHVTDTLCVWPG
jgi:hypothetical protein